MEHPIRPWNEILPVRAVGMPAVMLTPGELPLERRYPVGTRVRVLPNHACLMAAPYDRYYLVRGTDPHVEGIWPKVTGWSSTSLPLGSR